MFSIVHVAEKEITEEGIPVLQIKPAGGLMSKANRSGWS